MVLRLPLSQGEGPEPVGVGHRVCKSQQVPICIRDRSQEMILRRSTRRSALGLVQKDVKMGDLKDSIEKCALNGKSEPLPNTGCDKTCKETMPPGVNSD